MNPQAYPCLPDVDFVPLKPFWSGLQAGALRFPQSPCGRFQWYPQALCPACHSPHFDWVEVAPRGTLFTFTIVRHPFIPKFAPELPLCVAIVEIQEAPGVRLVTRMLSNTPQTSLKLGADVAIGIVKVGDDAYLPFARPFTSVS
jgi:uncharacterized OB-fold protein